MTKTEQAIDEAREAAWNKFRAPYLQIWNQAATEGKRSRQPEINRLKAEIKRLQSIVDAAMCLRSARNAGQDDEEILVAWESLEEAVSKGS